MKLTDYIVKYLEYKGIDIVFGYQGGSIADLIDSISKSKIIKFVQNYHEQASSFCANAYSEITGKTGVAISSSGPGAINLINGIANSYYDSIPCVFITGNVHTLGKKENELVRQNAFQETDIVKIAKCITKKSYYVDDPLKIKDILDEAFYIANEGRKGSVLIDIPYNIQRCDLADIRIGETNKTNDIKISDIDKIVECLKKSKKPVMLLGNGACDARKEILEFINTKLQIPTVVSLKALDILPSNNDAYIGMVGSFGHRSANLAIKHCDLLLVLGSRLDERQAGFIKNEFAPNATVVRVDIDKTEITRKVDSKYSVCTSVKNFINSLMRYEYSDTNCVKYLNLLKQLKIAYPSYCTCEGGDVNNFIRNLTKELDDWSIITSDVGITQMCVAQSVYIKEGNRVLNSAGLGSMGYSLPAAIGSSYALGNKKKIISFSGDGGLQMNIQELQLIDANKLPIFVVCLNNTCLGMIRNLQDNLFDSNYIGSVDGYSVPDFSKIANAYNLRYMCVENLDNYKDVIEFIKDNPRGFIEVKLPQKTLAHPMPGKKIYEQTPIIENIERWFE